jgi:hypothetical protein
MTEDLFRFGQQVLAAQPFSVLLGAQLTAYIVTAQTADKLS